MKYRIAFHKPDWTPLAIIDSDSLIPVPEMGASVILNNSNGSVGGWVESKQYHYHVEDDYVAVVVILKTSES